MPENNAQGMKLLEEKDYEGALAAFKNVAEVDADYEDLPDLVKEANEEFEAQKAALEDRLLESARQDNAEDAVLSSLREQAERGDADAQFYLGFRYAAGGRGVPRDDKEAARWFRAAAEQGEVDSQILLGGMYKDGKGVPQDHVRALMWYLVAASLGEESAPERRDDIAEKMTPEQIAEAERLAREWKPISR